MDHRRGVCPYMNNRDARCAQRLTMLNLPTAFKLCVGNYEACNIYHQIRLAELRERAELLVAQSA